MSDATAEARPKRTDGPVWRIAGAAGGWLLFAFFTTLILRAALAVLFIGGSCASGGPYVIGVQCPRAVLIVIPGAFFLTIAAVIAGAIIQRGFGTPLLSWAWGLAFGALGIGSIVGGVLTGGVWYYIGGALFLVFSIPVLVFEFRQSPLRFFIGATNLREQGFIIRTGRLRRMFRRKKQDYEQVIDATVQDGVAAIAATAPFTVLGAWLGWVTFDALG